MVQPLTVLVDDNTLDLKLGEAVSFFNPLMGVGAGVLAGISELVFWQLTARFRCFYHKKTIVTINHQDSWLFGVTIGVGVFGREKSSVD